MVKFRTMAGHAYRIEEPAMLAADSWRILIPIKVATANELVLTLPRRRKGFYRALLAE